MSEEKDKGITDYDDLPEHPAYTDLRATEKPPHTVKAKKQKQRRFDVKP